MKNKPSPRAESGFSLVEVLVAALLLVVGVLSTLMVTSAASRANAANRQRDAATNLARDVVEAVRTVPYERITDTGLAGELQRVPGLEDQAGGGYNVTRGGIDFRIAVDSCVVDDQADGGGPRPTAMTVCPGSTAAGTQDRDPEDYKRVTATISWRQAGGRSASLVQTGIVNNPGSASGPAIRSITPERVLVTDPFTTSVVVGITTSSRPTAVNWLLDGTVQQPAPIAEGTTGLAWTFTWPIGLVGSTAPTTGSVLDGDYVLSAEAFNQFGVSGPGRQETVTLNRRVPYAVRQVAGGRTQFGVELEWTANAERDIVGYAVFREDASGTVPVCPLATQKLLTECRDPSPPAPGPLKYVVYAYDTDPTTKAPRPGDPSAHLIGPPSPAPYPPTQLTATRDSAGVVTLRWKRPSPEDPEPSDSIEFYRVYRDGQTLDDRFARWYDDSTTITWRDTATNGATHTYWVSAVDKHFAESPLGAGVTG